MLARRIAQRQLHGEKGEEEPPLKRSRRITAAAGRLGTSASLRVRESALFRPVRAIGTVTDSLPFSLQTLGDASFVSVSIGRGFQVFECEKLRLAYIGPRLNEKVRAITTVGETIITALKLDIVVWHRVNEIGRFRGHHGSATVLCPLGSSFLLSAAGSEVLVWSLSELAKDKDGVIAPLGRLELVDFGAVTSIRHPPTYLHKVLVAGTAGSLELWNVRSRQRIHSFQSHRGQAQKQKADDAVGITAMMEAPNVLDVVAVGFASGRICMMNVREDRLLFEFQQSQGRVTCLTFRSDDNSKPNLVSGGPTGEFVVWDLEKRRLIEVHEHAHKGPISSAVFLPKEPLLLTSGGDNAVRMWIFDTADGLARYLKGRCGCPGPARKLQFYGEGDKDLLVGGGFQRMGYMSKISFIQDQQNREYSQAMLKKISSLAMAGIPHKDWLPPVVDMAACQVRHFDWPCVVTAHDGLYCAVVWSASHQALSQTVLVPPRDQNGDSPVCSVAISSCGNYCVLGLENGSLHRFNLQSGLHRGNLPRMAKGQEDPDSFGVKAAKRSPMAKSPAPPPKAHSGRVCGVVITTTAQVVSTATHPKDCHLKLWKLSTHEALASIPLAKGRPGKPSCLLMRALGALVATSLDDGTLPIADLNSMSIVRSFDCGVPAADLSFTSDGRWLAASLRDGGLRIFDLPAARCIDSFVFSQPALGLCFSPSGAFLLTTHAKNNAIQVWANKFLFDPSLAAPLLRPEPAVPINIEEPGFSEEEEDEDAPADKEAQPAELTSSTQPLESSLLTLSDVPPAKVLATLHLDLVKERNKLAEPPKPLPNAPFFLPTAHEGVTPRFAAPLGDEEGTEAKEDGKAKESGARPSLFEQLQADAKSELPQGLPFQRLLRKRLFDKALEHLKSQTPSGVHLAIEELGPMANGDEDELRAGLEFFQHHMAKSHFADEVQAFLSLFLAAHGEEIAASEDLRKLCAELGATQERAWSSLSARCQKARCFLGMLTQTQSQW